MGIYKGFKYTYNFDPKRFCYDIFIIKGLNKIKLEACCIGESLAIEEGIEKFIQSSIEIAIWYKSINEEE